MKKDYTKIVFYMLIVIVVLIFSFFLIPEDYMRSVLIPYAILALIFFALGIILIFQSWKKSKLLVVVGISDAVIPLCIILHNLVTALLTLLFKTEIEDNLSCFIPGMMSRKKQVAPVLTENL